MTAATAVAPRSSVVVRCALCGLWLIMPIPVAGAVASLLEFVSVSEEIRFGIFAIGILLFHAVAGALWGRGIARIFGWQPLGKFGIVGALGILLPAIIAVVVLGPIEENLIEFVFDGWRMHILFQLVFVPTAFLIGATGTGALGLAAGDWRLALRLALLCGLAAALTFFIITLLFDLFGMRVGAPRAEERATMLVVTLVGMWGAALSGNSVLGWIVERRQSV